MIQIGGTMCRKALITDYDFMNGIAKFLFLVVEENHK